MGVIRRGPAVDQDRIYLGVPYVVMEQDYEYDAGGPVRYYHNDNRGKNQYISGNHFYRTDIGSYGREAAPFIEEKVYPYGPVWKGSNRDIRQEVTGSVYNRRYSEGMGVLPNIVANVLGLPTGRLESRRRVVNTYSPQGNLKRVVVREYDSEKPLGQRRSRDVYEYEDHGARMFAPEFNLWKRDNAQEVLNRNYGQERMDYGGEPEKRYRDKWEGYRESENVIDLRDLPDPSGHAVLNGLIEVPSLMIAGFLGEEYIPDFMKSQRMRNIDEAYRREQELNRRLGNGKRATKVNYFEYGGDPQNPNYLPSEQQPVDKTYVSVQERMWNPNYDYINSGNDMNDIIMDVENPTHEGYEDGRWYAPQKKGFDKNNRGAGIDINTSAYLKKYPEKLMVADDGRTYITEDDELEGRAYGIDEARKSLNNRIDYARKVTGSNNEPSEFKKMLLTDVIYNAGNGTVARTLFEDKDFMDMFMNGTDEQVYDYIKDYQANNRGRKERMRLWDKMIYFENGNGVIDRSLNDFYKKYGNLNK